MSEEESRAAAVAAAAAAEDDRDDVESASSEDEDEDGDEDGDHQGRPATRSARTWTLGMQMRPAGLSVAGGSKPGHNPRQMSIFVQQSHAQWENVQNKTFTRWANTFLMGSDCHLENVLKLSDGVSVVELVERITGYSIPGINRKPTILIQRMENINTCLEFLREKGVKLVNIGPNDIESGNLKIILGLIWTLILHFQLGTVDSGARNGLLKFVNERVGKYGLRIHNFSTCFQDGRILSALTNSLAEDREKASGGGDGSEIDELCPIGDITDAMEATQNAMRVAEKEFEIPPVMDADDMVHMPDEHSVMTYVSFFMQKHEEYMQSLTALDPGQCALEPILDDAGKMRLDEFNVRTFAHNGDPVTVQLSDVNTEAWVERKDGTSRVELAWADNEDGTFTVSTSVALSPGEYILSVKLNDELLPGCPMDIEVPSAEPEPEPEPEPEAEPEAEPEPAQEPEPAVVPGIDACTQTDIHGPELEDWKRFWDTNHSKANEEDLNTTNAVNVDLNALLEEERQMFEDERAVMDEELELMRNELNKLREKQRQDQEEAKLWKQKFKEKAAEAAAAREEASSEAAERVVDEETTNALVEKDATIAALREQIQEMDGAISEMREEVGMSAKRLEGVRSEYHQTRTDMQAEIEELKNMLIETQAELGATMGTEEQRKFLVNTANEELEKLRPWVGISIPSERNLLKKIKKEMSSGKLDIDKYGIDVEEAMAGLFRGVKVVQVKPGGPAMSGGLKRNDIIFMANGEYVTGNKLLREQIYALKAGDAITFQVQRGEDVEHLKVEVGAKNMSFSTIVQLRRIAEGIIRLGDDALIQRLLNKSAVPEEERMGAAQLVSSSSSSSLKKSSSKKSTRQ